MDREGPDMSARTDAVGQVNDPSFALGTSARVGKVLAKAEARAKAVLDASEESAAETRRTARREADQVADDARRAAEAAARARVGRISELRASIAARAGSLVEGLEGGELTAARLEERVDALGEAADRILDDVGAGDSPTRPSRTDIPAERRAGGRAPATRRTSASSLCSRTRPRPAATSRARSSGSRPSRASSSAGRAASPGGTSSAAPSAAAGTPPTSVATTGSPAANASNNTCGSPSVHDTCRNAWLDR